MVNRLENIFTGSGFTIPRQAASPNWQNLKEILLIRRDEHLKQVRGFANAEDWRYVK